MADTAGGDAWLEIAVEADAEPAASTNGSNPSHARGSRRRKKRNVIDRVKDAIG